MSGAAGVNGLSEARGTGNEDRTGGEVLGSKRLIESVIDEVIDGAVGLGMRGWISLVLKVQRLPLGTGYGITFDGVSTGLSELDEFAVGNAGSRP